MGSPDLQGEPAHLRDNHTVRMLGSKPKPGFPPLATVGEIEDMFTRGLPKDSPNREQRAGWASQLAQLMVRVAQLRHRQARGRNVAHLLVRLAAGVTAAVTTVAGGTLVAHLHGPGATALGLIAVILGVIAAVIAATRPGESYATDLVMAAQYERLWWDIYGFGTTDLIDTTQADFVSAWKEFTDRHETISATLGLGRAAS